MAGRHSTVGTRRGRPAVEPLAMRRDRRGHLCCIACNPWHACHQNITCKIIRYHGCCCINDLTVMTGDTPASRRRATRYLPSAVKRINVPYVSQLHRNATQALTRHVGAAYQLRTHRRIMSINDPSRLHGGVRIVNGTTSHSLVAHPTRALSIGCAALVAHRGTGVPYGPGRRCQRPRPPPPRTLR